VLWMESPIHSEQWSLRYPFDPPAFQTRKECDEAANRAETAQTSAMADAARRTRAGRKGSEASGTSLCGDVQPIGWAYPFPVIRATFGRPAPRSHLLTLSGVEDSGESGVCRSPICTGVADGVLEEGPDRR
jgi:hypothetical protein